MLPVLSAAPVIALSTTTNQRMHADKLPAYLKAVCLLEGLLAILAGGQVPGGAAVTPHLSHG